MNALNAGISCKLLCVHYFIYGHENASAYFNRPFVFRAANCRHFPFLIYNFIRTNIYYISVSLFGFNAFVSTFLSTNNMSCFDSNRSQAQEHRLSLFYYKTISMSISISNFEWRISMRKWNVVKTRLNITVARKMNAFFLFALFKCG